MASIVIGLADVLLDLGVNVALVQNPEATQAHFDTAWTIRLVQTSVATAIVIFAAPFAAAYFKDPRIEPVLYVMSMSLLIAGMENIGVVAFQKELRFGAEFRFVFMRRLAGFLVTVIAVWFLRSYWALVIGTLAGRIVGVLLSYAVHPMRPRLSLAKFREIFSVSQWMLARSIGGYIETNLHRALVGRSSSAATMGAYTMADEISAMPTGEILAPLNRVLFPAFAASRDNLQELKRLFLRAQSVQALITIPAAVGLALVADDAVRLLLGDKWLVAVPFIQVLTMVNVSQALTTSSSYVLIVLGKVRHSVISMWLLICIFGVLAVTVFEGAKPLEIAWLRLIVGTCGGVGIACWLLVRALPIVRYRELFGTSVRPILGSAGMAVALIAAAPYIQLPIGAAIFAKIALGTTTYLTLVLAMWRLAGKPEGAESYLLNMAKMLVERLRN